MNNIAQAMPPSAIYHTGATQTSTTATTNTMTEAHPVTDSISIISPAPPDFLYAQEPLSINRFRVIRNNEKNEKIKSTIKLALTSSECAPNLKRKIFENIINIANSFTDESGKQSGACVEKNYLEIINALLQEIRESGKRIILDNIDFTCIHLKHLDFTNASAVSTKFNKVKMERVTWTNVDFSSAQFISSEIFDCHFSDVVFKAAVFMKCTISGGILNNVALLTTRFYEINFDGVLVPQLESDDEQLRKKITQSVVLDLVTMPQDSAIGDPQYSEFYKSHRRKALDHLKDQSVYRLNFKHIGYDPRENSVSVVRTALQIREAVPALPVDVTELIGQYVCEDCLLAEQPLQTKFRSVIDNEQNQAIKSAIKKILTARDGSLAIKRAIFKNLMDFNEKFHSIVTAKSNLSAKEQNGENSYTQAINEILSEIRASNNRIILDHVDFTKINLSDLDLTGASAVSAKFNTMQMKYIIWKDGNFSKSQFYNVNILQCRFKKSIFNKSTHTKTYFSLTELTRTKMLGVEFQRTKFDRVFVNGLKTDDPRFSRRIRRSRIALRELAQACLQSDVLMKSISSKLIFQYGEEERTPVVIFLDCEFTTKKQHQSRLPSQSTTHSWLSQIWGRS